MILLQRPWSHKCLSGAFRWTCVISMEQLLCAFVQSKVTDMLQESRAGRLHVEGHGSEC